MGVRRTKKSTKRKLDRATSGTLVKRVNSRRKGIRGELEARDLWREFYPDCQRSFGQARRGYEQPDLIGGEIEKKWYIEVKLKSQKVTLGLLQKWWSKLMNDRAANNGWTKSPLLMYRQNRNEWRIVRCPHIGEFVDEAWEEFRNHLRTLPASPQKE